MASDEEPITQEIDDFSHAMGELMDTLQVSDDSLERRVEGLEEELRQIQRRARESLRRCRWEDRRERERARDGRRRHGRSSPPAPRRGLFFSLSQSRGARDPCTYTASPGLFVVLLMSFKQKILQIPQRSCAQTACDMWSTRAISRSPGARDAASS